MLTPARPSRLAQARNAAIAIARNEGRRLARSEGAFLARELRSLHAPRRDHDHVLACRARDRAEDAGEALMLSLVALDELGLAGESAAILGESLAAVAVARGRAFRAAILGGYHGAGPRIPAASDRLPFLPSHRPGVN